MTPSLFQYGAGVQWAPWKEWWSIVIQLRPAFTRTTTFMWFAVAVAGMSIRSDLRGITGIVRAWGLAGSCHDRLLDMFHSTDTTLKLEDILRAYGLRFKIEVGFKQAVHTIGVFAYHFWMRAMTPHSKKSGGQHLHRKPEAYRDMVKRKMHAYHMHMQAGVIAQGIAQILAITSPKLVWKHFGSWIRTIREGILPSEQVTVIALRNTLPEFLADSSKEPILAEFVKEKIDLNRAEGLRMIYSNSA